jgi:hypothetical protein
MEIKDQQQEEVVVVNQFEVEELEDRLENKWTPCPTAPAPGTNCNINF